MHSHTSNIYSIYEYFSEFMRTNFEMLRLFFENMIDLSNK